MYVIKRNFKPYQLRYNNYIYPHYNVYSILCNIEVIYTYIKSKYL